MTDELNVATFDIADMFAGITYPQDEVVVYTNPGVAYDLHKLSQEAIRVVQEGDEKRASELDEEQKALVRKGETSRYVIHLRGQSRDNRRALIDQVREEFPVEVDFLGREKANAGADELFANLTWALHIEKIVAPNGAVKAVPEVSDVKILRGQLPDSEVAKVEKGIQNLTEGAKSGFETLAQEHDFLYSASPEA